MDFRRRLQYQNPVHHKSRWFDGWLIDDDAKNIGAGAAYGVVIALLTAAFIYPY